MSYTGQVLAVDADVNPAYARVVYSLRPTSAEFDLDSTTGELRTLRPIDRELESVYLLYICAHDADKPALHQCINATVNIEDVNDNYPVVFDVSDLFQIYKIKHCTCKEDHAVRMQNFKFVQYSMVG